MRCVGTVWAVAALLVVVAAKAENAFLTENATQAEAFHKSERLRYDENVRTQERDVGPRGENVEEKSLHKYKGEGNIVNFKTQELETEATEEEAEEMTLPKNERQENEEKIKTPAAAEENVDEKTLHIDEGKENGVNFKKPIQEERASEEDVEKKNRDREKRLKDNADFKTHEIRTGAAEGGVAEGKVSEHNKESTISDDETAEANRRNKFFLWASYTTTTKFKLSFTTSTIPATCFTAIATDICTGRRRKRSLTRLAAPERPQAEVPLSSSIGSPSSDVSLRSPDDEEREARKLLTVWSTAFSTKTVTTYFVNTSVTAKVSAQCSIMGIAFPACPG